MPSILQVHNIFFRNKPEKLEKLGKLEKIKTSERGREIYIPAVSRKSKKQECPRVSSNWIEGVPIES